jgi:CheY-like chemotaxis protein
MNPTTFDQNTDEQDVGGIAKLVLQGRKSILVVDDTPFVLSTIKDILGDKYDLRMAKNTTMAFGILHDEPIDLVLLDIEMPGMSGIDFFEFVKGESYFKNTKVVFITASADRQVVTKALGLGAKGYIVKPIHPDVLLKKVKEVLGET